ncbi:hypothetical protein LTR70_000588 [Exophiala xenobiotica]|uniref:Uncharacterized protein n=1 Tax=Lithohypha guttulata TaxID=1690604 RepID=A0ABR0KIR6_9EURO|nr:hypothetical protein LTR24_002165 [Lithohypha guttulata]KAK5329439.1 hypothetical protein LTR70_000588 [Exophiala xenobiotica]
MPPVTAAITFIAGLFIGVFFQLPKDNLIPYQWSHRPSEPTFTPELIPQQPLTLPPTEDFIPPPEFLQKPYCGYWERDAFIDVQLSNLSNDPAPGEYFVDTEGRIISCVASSWPEAGWQMRWFKTQRWCREHLQPWLFPLLELFAAVPSYTSRIARDLRTELASRNARIREQEDLKEAAQQDLEHTQKVLSASTEEIEKLQKGLTEQKEDFQNRDKDKTAEITDLKRELGTIDYTSDPARPVGIPEVEVQVQRLLTLKAREEEYRKLFYETKADLNAKDEALLGTKEQVHQLEVTMKNNDPGYVDHLRRQISNLKIARDDAVAEKRKAENERDIAAMESEPLVEENTKLKKEARELRVMLNGRDTELTSLRPMHAELLQDNQRLSAQVSDLEKKAAAPVDQKEGSDKHQDQVKKLSARLNRRDTEFTTLELTNAATLKANERLTIQVSNLEKKAAASTKQFEECTKLQEQVTDLKAKLNDIEAEITSLTSQSSTTSNENENLAARVQDLEKDVAAQTSRGDTIQHQLETRSNECLKSQNEKLALEHELSELRAQRDGEASAEVASLESRVLGLKEQVKTLTETVGDEQGQKQRLSQDYKALQADKQRVDISHAELRAQHEQLQLQSQAARKPAVKPSENASTVQKPASGETGPVTNLSEPRVSRGTPPSISAKETAQETLQETTTLELPNDQRPVAKVSLPEVEADITPKSVTFNRQPIPTPNPREQSRIDRLKAAATPKTTEVPPLGDIKEALPSTYTLKDYISANPRPQVKTSATKEYKEQAQYRHACWRCEGQGHTAAHCGVWKAQGAFLRLKDKYAPTLGDVAELERRILGDLCFACGEADHNYNEQKCPSSARTHLNPAAATFNPSGAAVFNPAATAGEAAATQHGPAQKSTPSGPRKLLEEVRKYPHVSQEELYSRVNRKLCLYCGESGHNDKHETCSRRCASVTATVPTFFLPQQQAFHFSVPGGASSSFNFGASTNNVQPVWNPFANIGGGVNGASSAPQSDSALGTSAQTNKTTNLFTNLFGSSTSQTAPSQAPTTAHGAIDSSQTTRDVGTRTEQPAATGGTSYTSSSLREDAQEVEPVRGMTADASLNDPITRASETKDARPNDAKLGAVEFQVAQQGVIGESQPGEEPEAALGQVGPAGPPVNHEESKKITTTSTPVFQPTEKATVRKKQLGGKPSKWADPDYVPRHISKPGDVKASPPSRKPADTREPAVKAPIAPVTPAKMPVKEAVSHTALPPKPSPPPQTTGPDEVNGQTQSAAQKKRPTWEPDMTSKWARSPEKPKNTPKSDEKVTKSSPGTPGHASNAESATQPIASPQPSQTQPVGQSPRPSNTGVPEMNRRDNRIAQARGRGRGQGAGRGKASVAGQSGFDRAPLLADLASKNAASEKQAIADSEARVKASEDEQKRSKDKSNSGDRNRGRGAGQGGFDRTTFLAELASKNAASEKQAIADSEARVRAFEEEQKRSKDKNKREEAL